MAKNSAVFFQAILIGFVVLLATGPVRAALEVPPEPPSPKRGQMSNSQFREAWAQWRADHATWEASLTAEQLAEHNRIQREAQDKDQEKFRRQQRLPLPSDGYDWKQTAAERKLTPDTIQLLEQRKIAFGDSSKQSFGPYLGGPVFITSDSLLNGFHVLFEDSFRELELRNAEHFRVRFEQLLFSTRELAGKKPLSQERSAAAVRHVELVLGPALLLTGTPLEFFAANTRAEIAAQAEKIRRAEVIALPDWLAPAEPASLLALDYRRCKPVGFYADSPQLADYFRATRWLQMLPFRASREKEFDAFLLLALASKDTPFANDSRLMSRLLGPPDDPTMLEVQEFLHRNPPRSANELDAWQRSQRIPIVRVLIERGYYRINSDLRLHTTMEEAFKQLTFRVLSPYALPDATLFQRLLDRNLPPSGLAVAAMLGSTFAESRLTPNEKAVAVAGQPLLPEDLAQRHGQGEPLVYRAYLHALNALFLPPAPEAPAFMQSEAWQAKSCQTALAGWAQIRHTFTLQAKMNELYLGMVMVPPGFVETNPEFFARMAHLIESAQDVLEENGGLRTSVDTYVDRAGTRKGFSTPQSDLRQRWTELARIARMLESMAGKELRQEPWTKPEEGFLRTYGETMAGIMGYDGNSWLSPRDDAPRWAEVCGFPDRGVSLAAAIGRPRTIYVLYPWNGMDILCVGSVMQYYEYESKQRLTDGEWLSLLDSTDAPALPAWMAPYAKTPAKPAAGQH
jgi:hypothetical protein